MCYLHNCISINATPNSMQEFVVRHSDQELNVLFTAVLIIIIV